MIVPDEHYWLNNYGHCDLTSAQCKCLKTEWLGQICPNWKPIGVKSYEEFKTFIESKRKSSKVVE